MSRRQKVLVIDDDPAVRRLVAALLRPLDVDLVEAAGGPEGMRVAQDKRPDLILLDVELPAMSGYEVCSQLRQRHATQDTPIIFLTGTDELREKVRAFELGAVDYVTKPFEGAELRARVGAALRTQALVHCLEEQAFTDNLTGLPNRKSFRESLTRCIDRARVEPDYRFAVLFLDLDRFKVINDSLGHAVGDELLVAIAHKLQWCVRNRDDVRGEDVVARMGGDEFTVLLDGIDTDDAATEVARRVQVELAKPCRLRGYQVTSGVSIGVCMCDHRCGGADELLRDADTAMYHAKAGGRARWVMFDHRMHQEAVRRLELEHDLRAAVTEQQFRLDYQPVIDLESGDLLGFEALTRWHHPRRGIVPPDDFIHIAEETGLIGELGRWALERVCEQLADWQQRLGAHGLVASLNLAKRQLCHPGLADDVAKALATSNLKPGSLQLEIAEGAVMRDPDEVLPALERLRDLGVRLALDDFGTGYSALGSLHRFPLDVLKIDETFTQAMAHTRAYTAIVHSIVTLAHNLGMAVVAEGIETGDQLVQLQALECDRAQGFLFMGPLSPAGAERLLIDHAAPFRPAVHEGLAKAAGSGEVLSLES